MKKLILISGLIGLGVLVLSIPAFTQERHTEGSEGHNHLEKVDQEKKKTNGDIDKLYELVRQARTDLEALRVRAGIPREGRGEHVEGEREDLGEHAEGHSEGHGEHAEGGSEGRGEHAEGHSEGHGEHAEGGREGRGEHSEGHREGAERSGEGEEGGVRIAKNKKWDATRNGARLVLAYNPATQSFKGAVHNTTSKTLEDVRVEVHLSNGVELGPTKRTDLKPGTRIAVELSAANQKFTWWTTHPEHGSEEGHGPGHEEERGEHGEGDGSRPNNPALRPLYNELQLLRQEIKILSRNFKTRKI